LNSIIVTKAIQTATKLHRIDVSACHSELIHSVGSHLHENNRDADRHPTEYAACSKTTLDVCLNHEEADRPPENDLKGVEYRIGLETMPPLEKLEVFGEYLIKDDDKRFGSLFSSVQVMICVV
jgi:hypothetical protein